MRAGRCRCGRRGRSCRRPRPLASARAGRWPRAGGQPGAEHPVQLVMVHALQAPAASPTPTAGDVAPPRAAAAPPGSGRRPTPRSLCRTSPRPAQRTPRYPGWCRTGAAPAPGPRVADCGQGFEQAVRYDDALLRPGVDVAGQGRDERGYGHGRGTCLDDQGCIGTSMITNAVPRSPPLHPHRRVTRQTRRNQRLCRGPAG
jgi:hypothetical protein